MFKDSTLSKLRYYQTKAVLLVPFYWLGLTILSDLMDWPAASQWSANLHTTWKLLAFPHFCMSCWMWGTVLVGALPHIIYSFPLFLAFCGPWSCMQCLTESNCLASFMLFSSPFCSLHASTLWVYNSTLSLRASSVFSNVYTSYKISLIMASWCSPHMNYSVSNLSYSL